MKKKKSSLKKLMPVPAAAAVFALAASGAHAQTVPIFEANFPTSWSGTGTTVTDLSGAGNTGFQSGTATYVTTAVPPGAAAGTGSMALSGAGGIKVTGPTGQTALLNNAAVADAGGFIYNIDFLWNGGTTSYGTQKLIDYAGTESLELDNLTANTSATLDMEFADDSGTETEPVSTTIAPNTWYDVTMEFNTQGNSLSSSGDISGIANLYVNGNLMDSAAATKGTSGDSLGRPIAIGELAYGHTTSIVGLDGDIYSASVELVPEPSSLALGLLGGLGVLGMRWKARRKS
ncbi:MAG: PEP-CTERM sorting domain-containing protein [Limisphaerales bacterium]